MPPAAAEARKVVEEILALTGYARGEEGVVGPMVLGILRAYADQVRAEEAEDREDFAAGVMAEASKSYDEAVAEADSLRAQLSEAQARLASAMAEVHRHTQRADREMYRADKAQHRMEALEVSTTTRLTMPTDDREAEAQKVADLLVDAFQSWLVGPSEGLYETVCPIILDFAKRVREPLRKIIDGIHQALGESEHSDDEGLPEFVAAIRADAKLLEKRWETAEAEAARLKAELESKVNAIRSLQARLTAQTEHLQKFVDGNGKRTLRAQLSEAQAEIERLIVEQVNWKRLAEVAAAAQRSKNRDIEEALNSGDGTYKP